MVINLSGQSLLQLITSVIGTPPEGYEYLPYKTACVLLIGFCASFCLMLLQFQRTFSRRSK